MKNLMIQTVVVTIITTTTVISAYAGLKIAQTILGPIEVKHVD